MNNVSRKDLRAILGAPSLKPLLSENEPMERGRVITVHGHPSGGYVREINVIELPDSPAEETGTPKKGSLKITGPSEAVVKETVGISFKVAEAYLKKQGESSLGQGDLHIQVPENPNKGEQASTGLAFSVAFVSQSLRLPVPTSTAFVGEVMLNGQVSRVEGILEKVLALKREGMGTLVLPKQNLNDVVQLEETIKQGVEFVFVKSLDQTVDWLRRPARAS